MPEYSAEIGVYVRAYAQIKFNAADDAAAPMAAIVKYNSDDSDIMFNETDWSNTCQPSIVIINNQDEDGREVADSEGIAFCLNGDDSRDYAGRALLAAAYRAVAALEANAAPNCEAAKELRAAIKAAEFDAANPIAAGAYR